MRAELAEREQRGGRHDRPRDVAQDQVDPVHQLGAHQREPPRLVRELARVRVGADPRRLEPAGPGDDDAARQHFVARRLGDRIRLAGEQRLVELEPVGRGHDAVGRDLVARAQHDEVVEHDLLDRDLDGLAVAHDASRAAR